MKKRLRPKHTDEFLAKLYPEPHDHLRFDIDHDARVRTLIHQTIGALEQSPPQSIADLSCGNGYIADALAEYFNATYILGDYAPGRDLTGPIEETIEQIPEVDLFILSETLEHLDDPDAVLAKIRAKAKTLALTTPIENWGDGNLEHYWSWDSFDIHEMLAKTGWTHVRRACTLDTRLWGHQYAFYVVVVS